VRRPALGKEGMREEREGREEGRQGKGASTGALGGLSECCAGSAHSLKTARQVARHDITK